MDSKSCFTSIGNVLIIFMIIFFFTTNVSALQNGDFSDGLNGWIVESGFVSNGGGYALFEEHPIDISSTLSHEFIIPDMAKELTFQMLFTSIPGGDGFTSDWPDSFTVSLLDPLTRQPLISNEGYSDFFYWDNRGGLETIADYSGNIVSLDVSGLSGSDACLVFDLWMSYDGQRTTAALDDVNISVIPAPGALMLGMIGISMLRISKKYNKSFKNT